MRDDSAKPSASRWVGTPTISSVMRNAFVSAFARSLEGSITLRDVKKNLREIGPAYEVRLELAGNNWTTSESSGDDGRAARRHASG